MDYSWDVTVHPIREFPLYVLELPKCRQRMCVKPDNPRGPILDPTTSHHTCVHTMWTHTSFGGIPTLRGAASRETLIR